mgnify:CR=1 FL=1
MIDDSVEVGAYSIIGPDVVIGAGTKVGPHVVIEGHTTIREKVSTSVDLPLSHE